MCWNVRLPTRSRRWMKWISSKTPTPSGRKPARFSKNSSITKRGSILRPGKRARAGGGHSLPKLLQRGSEEAGDLAGNGSQVWGQPSSERVHKQEHADSCQAEIN